MNPKIKFLLYSNVLSWLTIIILTLFWLYGTNSAINSRFINAERINIVGEDGNIVLAISNKKWMPGPYIEGVEYPRWLHEGRSQQNGMIFFNDEGDEVGGLLYNAIQKDSGRYWSGGHFSFDQYKQNQVVAMQYLDNSVSRRAGLRVWDRPVHIPVKDMLDLMIEYNEKKGNTETRDSLLSVMQNEKEQGNYGTERLFIGSQNEEAQIQLRDRKGNIRLKVYVDSLDNPRIDFLNDEEQLIKSIQ